MLEKLALLKIAFCRAPAFSSTSSACVREVTSPAPSETPIRVLVTSFPLAMVLPSGNLYCPVRTELASRSPISSTPRPPWAGYPPIFLGFPPTVRAVGLSVEDKGCRRWLRRGRYNGVAGRLCDRRFRDRRSQPRSSRAAACAGGSRGLPGLISRHDKSPTSRNSEVAPCSNN